MDFTETQRIKLIRTTIKDRGAAFRQQFPLLKYQNWIGMGILCFAIIGMIITAGLYLDGTINGWVCVPLIAVFASLLHELEHDLIHWQYFKKQKFMNHLMMLLVWLFRPTAINPWVRRRLHLLHHKVSGTSADIEEKGIGNGLTYGPLRFFIMFDTFTGNIVNVLLNNKKGKKLNHIIKIMMVNLPLPLLCAFIWYSFLGIHLFDLTCELFGFRWAWSEGLIQAIPVLQPWVVIVILPAYLRSYCLNFISSSMHYYGDVKSLMQQTQVLNAWYLWPLQVFCFNFGSTHGIHHFVINEPFYIRQFTASTAHKIMKEQGVRFNDLQTFRRANRFERDASKNKHTETIGV